MDVDLNHVAALALIMGIYTYIIVTITARTAHVQRTSLHEQPIFIARYNVRGQVVIQKSILGDGLFSVLALVVVDDKRYYTILPLWYTKDQVESVTGSFVFAPKYDWSDTKGEVEFSISGTEEGNNIILFTKVGTGNTIATCTLDSTVAGTNKGSCIWL